jgi:hypothetical protein
MEACINDALPLVVYAEKLARELTRDVMLMGGSSEKALQIATMVATLLRRAQADQRRAITAMLEADKTLEMVISAELAGA